MSACFLFFFSSLHELITKRKCAINFLVAFPFPCGLVKEAVYFGVLMDLYNLMGCLRSKKQKENDKK